MTNLLDQAGAELDKPASLQSLPALLGCLEGALRSSTVQFVSRDMLDRLDIELAGAYGGHMGKRGTKLEAGPGATVMFGAAVMSTTDFSVRRTTFSPI